MRALIYCRVSTDEQAEHGHSLAAQEQLCRERAAADGMVVEHVYVDDGYRASTLDRPGLNQLLRTARPGVRLYVWKQDRLTRTEDATLFIGHLQATGVIVVSVTEGIIDVSTSSGFLATGVRSIFNAYERRVIGERAAMGLRRRIESGKPFSKRPYGFKPGDAWEIDDDKATIIRLITRLRLAGQGLHSICRYLDAEGFPPPGRGERWHSWSVSQILHNPIYSGIVWYRGELTGVTVPAVIDPDTWGQLQIINAARRNVRTREATDYLLSGLVWCECEARMGPYRHQSTRPSGQKYRLPSYRCVARAGRPSVGHTNSVNAHHLAQMVLGHLDGMASSDSGVSIIVPPAPRVDVAGRLAALDRELEALEVHLVQGRIPPDRFDAHRARIEAARAEVLAAAGRQQDADAYRQEAMARLRSVTGNLAARYGVEGPTTALKAAVQQLVERIDISLPDGSRRGLASRRVTITLRPLQA